MRIRVRPGAPEEVTLNYVHEGRGPHVVLTHGLGGDVTTWETTATALRPRYRLLRWDVRGFGESDRWRSPVTPALWAADLDALLDALDVPEAVIVGISMGGVLAQRFALDFPRRTRALILLSTSSEVSEAARRDWEEHADAVERDGMEASGGLGRGLAYAEGYEAAHPEAVGEIRSQLLRNDPASYAQAARAVGNYRYTEELPRIECPTLILQGLEDRLTPPGGSVIMSRRIPNARLELIEGSGHSIPVERFDEATRLIDEFLASL